MNDWNIQSRAHVCQACETSFADKQPYHTLLFEEKHELKRIDVCEPCFKSKFSGAAQQEGLISRWQGVYEAPPPAPPEAIQKDTAESLLRKLVESNDPKHAAASFILAVMLERKRLLKVKEQVKREDGSRMYIYEQPKTGDVFPIADPNLNLNQLDEVQRDVAYLLEHGLNTAPAAAPAATEPENANSAPAEHAEVAAAAPEAGPAPEAQPEPATEPVAK